MNKDTWNMCLDIMDMCIVNEVSLQQVVKATLPQHEQTVRSITLTRRNIDQKDVARLKEDLEKLCSDLNSLKICS